MQIAKYDTQLLTELKKYRRFFMIAVYTLVICYNFAAFAMFVISVAPSLWGAPKQNKLTLQLRLRPQLC